MKKTSERKFYLCPPTFYSIEYVINDWMDLEVKADINLAQKQWETVVATYEKLGVEYELLEAIEKMPDLVFPGDSIFLYENNAIASNFRFQERASEVPPRAAYFSGQGYEVHYLPDEINFEGNAELMAWNGRLLGGYGGRSDKEAYPILTNIFDVEIVPLEICAPFFHLDVAICPLNDETIMYAPNALTIESIEMIEALASKTIQVDPDEANVLAANSMVVDNTVIMSTQKAPKLAAELVKTGFEVIELDLSEFLKSGGGVKCLTLEAY